MGFAAAIIGALGGLCAVLGVVVAFELIPSIAEPLTWNFLFFLSAILLLAAIAFTLGRSGGYD